MITVGLIKELQFISSSLKTPLLLTIASTSFPNITVQIENETLTLTYLGHLIWREKVLGDSSFFGVESCDTIARIMVLLKNHQINEAKELFYLEETT